MLVTFLVFYITNAIVLNLILHKENDNILYKVYIKRVPADFTEQELLKIFNQFGEPFKVYIDNLQWALIYFGTYEEANNSIKSLNGAPPYNFQVSFAKHSIYKMTHKEMTEMQGKLMKEAKKLKLKEAEILLKIKQLEYQMLLVDLNEDSSDNVDDVLFNENDNNVVDSFNSNYNSINTFLGDISGDIKPSEYGNSNYRNVCETYMSSWLKRFLENNPNKNTSNSKEKKGIGNQSHYSEIKKTSQNHSTPISHEQHLQSIQSRHKKINFKQKSNIKRDQSNIQDMQGQSKSNHNHIQKQHLKSTSQKMQSTNEPKCKFNNGSFHINSKFINDENCNEDCNNSQKADTTQIVSILSKEDQEQLKKFTVSKQNGHSYIELPNNEFTEVKVEWIESDLEGWVSLTSNENIMDKIILTLNDNQRMPILKPEVGLLCAANFNNEVWSRAVILLTYPDIIVHYIDYGNTEKVKINNLKVLQSELKNVPGLVLHIRLADGSVEKLSDGKKLLIKPVAKEGNFTICHSQNGFYPVEKTKHIKSKQMCSSPKDPTPIEEKSIVNLLKVGYTGILTLRTEVKNQEFIAIIIPSEFADIATKLKMLSKKNFDMVEENFLSKEGNLVLVPKRNLWMRGYILHCKSDELAWVVALIDDGVVQNVSEIKKISSDDAKLPEFACHLFITELLIPENEFRIMFKPGEHFEFEVLEIRKNSVMCMLISPKIEKGICKIEVKCWDYKSIMNQEYINLSPTLKLNTIPIMSGSTVRIILPNSQQKLLVQNKDAAKALKKLLIEMKSLCNNFKPLLRSPILGEILASRFSEDQQWYRIKVKHLNSDNTSALVEFIDYGNEEIVSTKDLRILPQMLLDISCCLIPVKLKDLPDEPLNVQQQKEVNKCITNNNNFIVEFDCFEEGITLYMQSNKNFNHLLMELGKTSKKNSNFEKSKNSNETESVSSVKDDAVIKDENSDLNTSIENVKCESSENFHIDSMKWSIGKAEVVFIDFFVKSRGIIVCILNDEDVLESIQRIDKQITKFVESKGLEYFIPEEGNSCLAKYQGVWYRALCLSKTEDKVLVLYVDYGNTETIPCTDVGKITKDLVQQPSVAMICNLFDDDMELSERQIKILESELVQNHVYDCEIIEEKGPAQYKIKLPHIEKLL